MSNPNDYLAYVTKNYDNTDKIEQFITSTLQQIDESISACRKAALSIYSSLQAYQSTRFDIQDCNEVFLFN